MTPERWQRVERLMQDALDQPADLRAAHLRRASGDDEALFDEVMGLLRSYDQVETYLESPAVPRLSEAPSEGLGTTDVYDDPGRDDPGRATAPIAPLEAGDRVGSYRLRRRLGRGGMGDVFLAERDDETFRRQVAVKVVHRGPHASGVQRRFKSERQILASLDHPNIARLLDGGSTDDGRPYLVMELVEGVPIDRYCDEQRWSIQQRLRLFLNVCSALQYAHQNLVVHRDIKPSNILVTRDGIPKLLDFGIAKLLNPELFPYTIELTRSELHPMTPQYASPEQLKGQAITTASDVYALGVLLYKLLAGRLPHFAHGLTPEELERVLGGEEPPRPSSAVRGIEIQGSSAVQLTPEAIAGGRATQPQALRRQLLGDLDNIALMALRKEPHRRYGSVDQLADDVQRHLADLPVRARPDTVGYRVRKFVGRNRVSVAAGGLAALLLMVFAVAVFRQAQEIRRERDRVALERDKAQRVADFMVDLFEVADPSESRGNTITVREVLDRGADKTLDELTDQPEIQSTLLMTIGRVYGSLGLYGRAGPLLEQALEQRRDLYGEPSLEVAESLTQVAWQRRGVGQPDLSMELLEQSLTMRQELVGERDPILLESLLAKVENQRMVGDDEGSERTLQQAFQIAQEHATATWQKPAETLYELARLSYQMGDLQQAEHFAVLFGEAIQRGEETHPQYLLLDLHLLGVIRRDLGKFDQAAAHLEESLEVRRKYWPQDPLGIQTLVALSRVHRLRGDLGSARQAAEACRVEGERWQLNLFPRNLEMQTLTGMCWVELAEVASLQGDEAARNAAVEAGLQVLGRSVPETLSFYGQEAWVRAMLLAGQVETARPVAAELLARGWSSFDFVELCRRYGVSES